MNARIDAVQRLAGLLVDDAALAAWDGTERHELWELAGRERVECLLARRLCRAEGKASEGERRRALEVLARAAIVAELRRRELMRLAGGLAQCGVRVLVLKGAAWAHTVYASPGLRQRLDTDLLIDARDQAAAHGALGALGYQPAVESVMALASAQRHYVCVDRHGIEHFLDLHWRVANPLAFAAALPFAFLWTRSEPIAALGGARTLGGRDALMLACLHRLAHHGDDSTLQWVMDIHLLAGRLQSDDWEDFVHEARANALSAVCARSLNRAHERFGTEVPRAVVQALTAGCGAVEPVFLGRGVSPLGMLASDWRAIGTWAGRLRLLRDHVCPAPSYMRARYGSRHAALLPFLYAHRALTGLTRWWSSHRAVPPNDPTFNPAVPPDQL